MEAPPEPVRFVCGNCGRDNTGRCLLALNDRGELVLVGGRPMFLGPMRCPHCEHYMLTKQQGRPRLWIPGS